jgi:BirA family biotin operon repressor/biotin-[acetyl-CoA-carboxylase] ligase
LISRNLPPAPSPLPPDLGQPLARDATRLGQFAHRILWYEDVSSTNDIASRLAEHGAEEGAVIIADAQSAGRGRQGRTWASPAGAGLYMSILLRPASGALALLTIAAGVAVAEAIEAATGLRPTLKWPNDVYLSNRKVAGLLAEANAPTDQDVQYVILGIGINIAPAAYPVDVAARATSLEAELGREVDRGLLLTECLAALAERYADLRTGRGDGVMGGWRRRAAPLLGRTVRWETDGVSREGVAEDIDESGALIVRTSAGPVRVIAGEVVWV